MILSDFIRQWRDFFRNTNGQVFGLTFQKSDGSIRTMSARTGVYHSKNAQAVQGAVDRDAQDELAGTLTVFDMNADKRDNVNKGGYRRFRFDRLISVRFKKREYKIQA